MEQENQTQKSGKYILPDGVAGQPGGKSHRPTVIPAGQRAPEDTPKASGGQDSLATKAPEKEPPADSPVVGGVPVEREDVPKEKRTATGGGRPGGFTTLKRRRKKPAMATAGQKLALLIMGVIFAFALGILTGVGLSWGTWSDHETLPPVTDGEIGDHIPVGTGQSTQPEEPGNTEDTTSPETEETENTQNTEDTNPTDPAETTGSTEPVQTEPQDTQTEPPATNNQAEYFFPDSDSRYLTEADCAGLSDWELVLARNEIFARHGRRFNTPEIQAYFDGCSWYEGTISPEDFDNDVLNACEQENVRLLKRVHDGR